MAKKFKDYYDAELADMLADKFGTVVKDFGTDDFVQYIADNVEGKAMIERQDVFADAFEKYLGDDYVSNLEVIKNILGPKLPQPEGMFNIGYWVWPIGRYVERHALDDVQASIAAIYEITQRFTGEFAVRPLIQNKPDILMPVMIQWSKDDSVHVRRLATEGVRISLPWAKKMTAAVDCWEQYKTILTNLKDDPEKFVQKSVGNNLNDLMKFDRVKALEIIDEWESGEVTKNTAWIIKHGRRSERKKA